MAMLDYENCWNTPCDCGWGYRNDTKNRRMKLASIILGIDLSRLKIGKDIPDDHPMKNE